MKFWRIKLWVSLLISVCAVLVHSAENVLPALVSPAGSLSPEWQYVGLDDEDIADTSFEVEQINDELVLKIDANQSYGNLVVSVAHPSTAKQLTWRWRLEQLNELSDLHTKQGDDAALKVCVAYDLPLAALRFFERQIIRLARLRSGRDLPTATLCYVWDNRLPVGTVKDNAYTSRLKWLVLRSGMDEQFTWRRESRDVVADFKLAFGATANGAPPISAIIVGADADNTQGSSIGYISELTFQ